MGKEHFYKNRSLDFAELRYSRGSRASFKPHMHRLFSIGAVEEGAVRYTVGGEAAVLRPGSLLLVNPEILHTCNPGDESGRSYYMLHLDLDWCCRVQQAVWAVEAFAPVGQTRIDDRPLYDVFCRTAAGLMAEDIHLQEKEQMLFDLAFRVFSAACSAPHGTGRAETDSDRDIRSLKKLLSEDLHRDFTIHSLAEDSDINPYRLIRSFKAATGITPHAYRMNCRIERARELLRAGEEIAETALACGFFDQSHFHRYFKAMTTVTPRAYRVNFLQ